MNIKNILIEVEKGRISAEDALSKINADKTEDLGFVKIDHARKQRCGFPEVVYGENKTPQQIKLILNELFAKNGYALATRVSSIAYDEIKNEIKNAEYDELSSTLMLGCYPDYVPSTKEIVVVAAGTSDIGVAQEAVISAKYARAKVTSIFDVGVAGIHRLFESLEVLENAGAIIAVAGMEGALPSVIGGLVSCPVIAVPTSVGYGASFGGIAALLGMLNSCASGIGVVNIDNGFGAGILAARIVLGKDNNE